MRPIHHDEAFSQQPRTIIIVLGRWRNVFVLYGKDSSTCKQRERQKQEKYEPTVTDDRPDLTLIEMIV